MLGKVVNFEQSAANLFNKEAQRPYVRINNKLSVHRPKHQFISEKDFGYYLAGVIDGDGSISKNVNKITICFHKDDISFALNLRTRIGYGKVSKRARNSVTYVVTHTTGLINILKLIYGKLLVESKINNLDLLLDRLNEKLNVESCFISLKKPLNNSVLFETAYLAGLIDTDGSLRVRVLNRKRKSGNFIKEVRLGLRIDLNIKDRNILDMIYKEIGGCLTKRYHVKSDTWSVSYDTVSFTRIFIILKYLDQYHLQSKQYLRYTIVRKAFLLVQEKSHLTLLGMGKIERYLKTLHNISKNS